MPPNFTLALNGMGTVAVDASVPAHSGARSVHIQSANGYQTFFALAGAPVFPAAGALYLRLYIRLGAAMSMGHNTHRTDWQQDPLDAFHFGFEKYAGPDVDIWYDDIAISTQPIGC